MGSGFVGILLAAIENILYTSGTLLDEFVTGSIAITDIMAVTIIMFMIVGVMLAVLTS